MFAIDGSWVGEAADRGLGNSTYSISVFGLRINGTGQAARSKLSQLRAAKVLGGRKVEGSAGTLLGSLLPVQLNARHLLH